MDWQRTLLIGAMLVVLYLLFLEWNKFEEAHKPAPVAAATTTVLDEQREQAESIDPTTLGEQPEAGQTLDGDSIPDLPANASDVSEIADKPAEKVNAVNSTQLIHISSDVLSILVDTHGGDVVRVELPQHRQQLSAESPPFLLLNRTVDSIYIAQSGLIGKNGTDTKDGRPFFTVSGSDFTLGEGENVLTVDFTLQQGGVEIIKRFQLNRGDYLLKISYLINNTTAEPWQVGLFGQIKRDSTVPPEATSGGMSMNPYLGAALTTEDENFKKVDFEDMDETLKETVKGGWLAFVQHYFISAWVPNQTTTNTFTLRKLGNKDLYTMGFTSPAITVAPGGQGELQASFYAGPKDQDKLEAISPYLDLTVDYGWLWWVAKPLFWVLQQLHNLLGNWGWAIIALTVLIKAAFFKLSATSYRSMANMRRLQPEMQRLKEMYGDDRQKMSQETMNLYKREKVNPMGGCLPILIQMPVFLSLYWVLFESVELRHAPWILWIQDLSVKDPLFILPVLMGASMFFQQKLNPTPPDPTQAKVMQMLPILFTFFFMFFPAGLVLYWTVNNVLSIAQQWYITRKVEQSS